MPQDPEAESELRNLAAVPYNIISPANNKSIIGIYQDSMLGCYQFTRENVKFTPRDAMNLLMMFSNINEKELMENLKKNESEDKGAFITNFNILSQIMSPLSMKYKTKAYKEDKDEKENYNAILEIRNGEYIRGQMNKSVLDDYTKGLIQRTCNDFGNMASAKLIDDLQNIVTEYMKTAGFSVGISDLISNEETNQKIVEIITNKKSDVKNLIDQVQIGLFENNTGKTNEQEFETQVNNILNKATDESGKVGLKSLNKNNRFVTMVNAGSKGSDLNITFMISCLGQQNVDGKRIPYGFEHRTLPHFTKFDDSPGARGFVESSYINGLSPQELFFHAMGGRVGLIDTAVKSVTWETPIIIIEHNQAKYTEIGRWIDNQLQEKPEEIQHFTERNMELLNIKEGDVFIPTTDENGIVTWGEITAITRHDPGTELYEIKTEGGRSVIVTESKSLLIWNPETKKLKEMPTPEIKVGNCVPVTNILCEPPITKMEIDMSNYLPKNEYIYGSEFHLASEKMKEDMIKKNKIPVGWWKENNGTSFMLPYSKKASLQRCNQRSNINNIKNGYIYPFHAARTNTLLPETFVLNEENGIFIGLFLAEGNAYKSNVVITNNNENIRSFVKKWFEKYNMTWKEKEKINHIGGKTTTISGSSSLLTTFLKEWLGHRAENKHVPSDAFIAPECFIIGLLNGYFSGDGTVSKNSIDASSASNRLIEGINMLCSRLGIFGKVSKSQLKKNNLGTKNIKPTYRLSIRAQWGKIFSEKITLLENLKNEKLKKIVWNTNHRKFDTYNDVVLDKITEINIISTEKHPKVYDLTIPSTLNFGLANGLQVRDTSSTGYIQRRLIKGLEDLMVNYDMTVRTNKNKIVQFVYGEDNMDSIKVENQPLPLVSMSVQDIFMHYNIPEETGKNKLLTSIFLKNVMTRYKKQLQKTQEYCKKYTDFMMEMRNTIIKNVFKNKGDSVVNCPVAFYYIINNIQGQVHLTNNSLVDITPLEVFELIEQTFANLEKITFAPPTLLFKTLFYFYLSPKELLLTKRFNRAALILLLDTITLDYKRAIITPGEMVGMIAGQSIGEVSTQMSSLSSEKMKIIKINKTTKIPEMISTEIGLFIDDLMEQIPEYTFNTGHNENSTETLLDALSDDYYIMGVSEDEKTSWNKISHVSRHPVNGEIMKVTTRSGRVVETTTSHSHLIRDKDSQKVVAITGANMKKGMRIPVAKHIDNTFIRDTVTIGNKEYKLDALFGWFIGAYLAEGNISNNQICITNISEYFIENTCKFARIFGKEGTIYNYNGEYGPGTTTKFNCKELAQLLLSECNTGSFIKKVPNFAFTAPNEFKAALIQAYVDGDGNFQNDKQHHQIRVCSRSQQLIKDIALLLNYFDIFGSIQENFTRGSKLYNLSISAKYAVQYKEKIGTLLHESILCEMICYLERDNLKIVPDYIDKINGLEDIVAYCGKTLALPDQSRIYGHYKRKQIESIGRRTLEKYIQVFETHKDSYKIENELNILRQAANANVIWDEITKIEISRPDQNIFVYDFTVPKNQTFMTDYGVIIHNTLNTFHFAGVSSKSNVTRGVPRIEEILSLSDKPKNPSLTVYLKEEDETNKDKANTIMYMLEYTKLEEIVKSIEICFDPDDLNTLIDEDKTTIEQFRAFENMVAECAETNLTAENEKSKWIIRMTMDPEVMLKKNITMDDVNFTLNNSYDNQLNCIYSDFNSEKLIFRIRMNEVMKTNARGGGPKKVKVNPLDQSDQIYILKNFQDQLLENIVLRGVKGINKVILRKIRDNVVETNGIFNKQDIWVLDTVGTNLLDVLSLSYIDNKRTFSNDIVEVFNTLGIEAARQAIYNEIVDVIEFDGVYINYHNFSVLCDRMTYSSKMISIFRHGINNDNIGPIAKASFEETPEMFLKAARHAELDNLRGISANVMCGQEGFFGTSSFQVVLDLVEMQKLEATSEYIPLEEEREIETFFGSTENPSDPCSISNLSIQNNVISIKNTEMGTIHKDYNPGF
jgi:DNA-directed RNA polymerase beta' subunit